MKKNRWDNSVNIQDVSGNRTRSRPGEIAHELPEGLPVNPVGCGHAAFFLILLFVLLLSVIATMRSDMIGNRTGSRPGEIAHEPAKRLPVDTMGCWHAAVFFFILFFSIAECCDMIRYRSGSGPGEIAHELPKRLPVDTMGCGHAAGSSKHRCDKNSQNEENREYVSHLLILL